MNYFRLFQSFAYFFIICLLINFLFKSWFYWYNYPFVAQNVQREISVEDILVQEMAFVDESIIQSIYLCKNTTKLLIAVISHVDDINSRQMIRKTWGNHSEIDVEIRFVVGYKTNTNKLPPSITEEQLTHKDLLITNVKESYYNLSLKTLAIIATVSNFCPTASCIAKSDDDNIINIKKLKKLCEMNKGNCLSESFFVFENLILLESERNSENESIHGYCLKNPQVLRRGLTSTKWDVPYFVYPLKRYPYYCRGGHYLITGKATTKKLLFGLKIMGFFKSLNLQRMPEDGIFTGFAAEIAGIKRISNSRFIPCLGKNGTACIDGMPYSSDWISAMIGNEKAAIEYLHKCSFNNRWENCMHNILFNQSALIYL